MMCVQGVCEAADPSKSTDTSIATTGWTTVATGETFGTSSDLTTAPEGTGELTDDGGSTTGDTDSGTSTCDDASCTGSTSDGTSSSSGASGSSESSSEPVPIELIADHGFEEGIGLEWGPFGGNDGATIQRSSDQAYEGSYSLRSATRSRTFHSASANVTNKVIEGVTYEVSAYLRLDGDSPPAIISLMRKMACPGYADNFAAIGSAEIPSDGWVQVTGSLVVSAGCNATEVTIYFQGAQLEDESYPDFFVDEVYATPIP